MIDKKVITKPINYAILNQYSTDFETRFVPQTESFVEQAFLSQYLVKTDEPNLSGTTIVEVPKELPKVSMELFTSFDQWLIDEVTEVQNVFKQMKLAVEQHCEEKSKVQTKMENVLQENDRLLTQALSVEIVNIAVHENTKSVCLNVTACARCLTTETELKTEFLNNECYDMLLQKYHTLEKHCITLEAQEKDTLILKLIEKLNSLNGDVKDRDVKRNVEDMETLNIELDHKEKVLVITSLKEQLDMLKGKAILTETVSLNPINPELLKVDVTLVVPKLRKNRTAHNDYIRHTQEEAGTLRKIVESERLVSPLNTSLNYVCKYTRRIQELLMILQQTCPYLTAIGTKLETVTPKNPTKQIRHTAQITKSESITVTTLPSTNLESNKPVISSTGVNLVSSASGSMSQDNTKNNRIRQTQKKAKKNKVEDHLRTVQSSLNKASVVDSKATSSVLNSMSNVNSNLKCALSNGCLLSDNHDTCVGAYKNYVNAIKKSKFVKTPIIRKVWKTTGKVFKTVGHIWKPTGRTFTLVGNVCPLTRIATPTIVPPREPILIVNSIKKPVLTLVIQIVLWYLDSGYSKHITGDRSQLVNFIQKFLGMVKFGNDHVAKIIGYGDYQIGNVTISQVRRKVPVRHIRTDNGTEFVNHTLQDYYEEVGISPETSVARSPQQNWVVKRRNRTLIEAARTMLIYAQAPLFLWAEAVATACFTQNRSIIRLRHGKTPYELLHNKLPDLSFFHVFGALYYLINDSENLGKLQPKADIRIFIGYPSTKKAFQIYNRRPALNEMTPGTISSGLVHTTSPSTYYVPPSRIDWDLLFQPMFDELLNPPPSVVNQAPGAINPIVEVIPPVNADSTGSPSSTIVEEDAPSTSNSTTPTETQSSIIPQDVRDENLDIEVAHIRSDPLFGIPIPEVNSEQSTTPASLKQLCK
nr:hypothetical protein [Tanacetum cinerariifolium]